MLPFVLLLFLLPGCSEYITKEELPELLESYDGTISAKILYVRNISLRYSHDRERLGGTIEVDKNGDASIFLGKIPGGTVYLSVDSESGFLSTSHYSGSQITLMSREDGANVLILPDEKDKNWSNAVTISTSDKPGKYYGARIMAADHRGKAITIYEPDPNARVGR